MVFLRMMAVILLVLTGGGALVSDPSEEPVARGSDPVAGPDRAWLPS